MSQKLDNNAIPSWLEAAINPASTAASTQPSSSESEPPITAPPSYNEAMTTCSGISVSTSPPSNKLAQRFFYLDAHGGIDPKTTSGLGLPPLTKAAGPVVCLYYNLMRHAVAYTIPNALHKIPIRPTPPAMVRLVIDSVANYAFMLALIHAGSTRAKRSRYSDMLLYYCDEAVSETRMYVREEIVRVLMEGCVLCSELGQFAATSTGRGGRMSYPGEQEQEWEQDQEWERDQEWEQEHIQDKNQVQVQDEQMDEHEPLTSGSGYDLKPFINDLLDSLEKKVYSQQTKYTDPNQSNLVVVNGDDELDGPQVQECWRLFKTVLHNHNHAQPGDTEGTYSGGSGGVLLDLLPPSEYWKYRGTKQECLRRLFLTKKVCDGWDKPCLLKRAFTFLCCGAQCS